MYAPAAALGAAAIDSPGIEIKIIHAEIHEFRCAQTVPVSEQDHGVVTRAVPRAFLRGTQKRSDFVAGEIVAPALFVWHFGVISPSINCAEPFESNLHAASIWEGESNPPLLGWRRP